MEKEVKLYLKIGNELIAKDANISHGKMMTSPGLKYKNKVFAFFHNNAITLKQESKTRTVLVVPARQFQSAKNALSLPPPTDPTLVVQ